MESLILDRVNAERASNGLAPLSRDSSLDATADVRSSEIAILFDHSRPGGGIVFQRFRRVVPQWARTSRKARPRQRV